MIISIIRSLFRKAMYLFYYDEVKYHPPVQESFLLGGVGLHHIEAISVEDKLSTIAERVFGTRSLERSKEFHGKEIFQGKGAFKGIPSADRLEILKDLLSVCAAEQIVRFYIAIHPKNFVVSQVPDEVAFMFLVEQINDFLEGKGEYGMIFGDYDEPAIGPSVISLSRYRQGGTNWSRGKKIDRLIDTVHFAKSHHSRLVQLADVFLYARQFFKFNQDGYWKEQFNKAIIESGVLNCKIVRSWPQEKVWYIS